MASFMPISLQTCLAAILAPALLAASPAMSAPKPTPVSTPSVGSPERTAILDAIRPAPGSKIRFIVHDLRVIKGRSARFAYAAVEPSRQEYDGGQFILKNEGRWRVIWSVTGGGTNTCADIAAYYRDIARVLVAEGIAADRLHPGHSAEERRLQAAAHDDADCNTIGDLGPELD